MKAAVLSLTEMSVRAGVLIVIAAIVRKGLLYRVPKGVFLSLWAVGAVRLLLPVTVMVPAVLPTRVSPAAEITVPPAVWRKAAVPPGPGSGTGTFPWLTVLWGVGAGLTALYFCTVYLRARRRFSRSDAVRDPDVEQWLFRHPLRRRIRVRRAHIASPVTCGVVRPVILLPAERDYAGKLDYILLHEYTHIKYFHSVMKLLLVLCLCLHWFNPAVWVMYFLANTDMELFCDERVLREYNGAVKADYALALVHMWSGEAADPDLHNHFSQNAVKERIVAIMKYKKYPAAGVLLALVLAVSVTCAAFAAAPDSAGPTAENDRTAPDSPVIVVEGEPVPEEDGAPDPKEVRSPEVIEDGEPVDKEGYTPWPTDTIAPCGELCFGTYMMQAGMQATISGTCPDSITLYAGMKNIATGQTITRKVTGGDYWVTVTVPADGDYCFYIRNASPEQADVELSYAVASVCGVTDPLKTKVYYLG